MSGLVFCFINPDGTFALDMHQRLPLIAVSWMALKAWCGLDATSGVPRDSAPTHAVFSLRQVYRSSRPQASRDQGANVNQAVVRHRLERVRHVDVWVMGEREFEETKNVIGGLAYPAHKYGVVLYENS